eukprot:234920-Amphidinium_carterae.1
MCPIFHSHWVDDLTTNSPTPLELSWEHLCSSKTSSLVSLRCSPNERVTRLTPLVDQEHFATARGAP